MTELLEQRLQAVAERLEPRTDRDLTADVMARLDMGGSDRRTAGRFPFAPKRRVRSTFAMLAVAAVVIIVLVLPGPRRTVANWFGIGSTHIVRTPQAPPSTASAAAPPATEAASTVTAPQPGSSNLPTIIPTASLPRTNIPATVPATFPAALDFGAPTSASEAAARTGLGVPSAPTLGRSSGIFVVIPPESGQIVVIYPPSAGLPAAPVGGVGALLSAMPGTIVDGLFLKVQSEGTTVESLTFVTSAGHRVDAVWLSGTPHTYVFQDRDGTPVFDTLRLATNTLLWEDAGVTYRLEAGVTREAAIYIAQSVVTT